MGLTISRPFVIVAHTRESADELVQVLSHYATAIVVQALDESPRDCLGVVTTLPDIFPPPAHVPCAWFRVSTDGGTRLETVHDLKVFASYCLARWVCGNDETAHAISKVSRLTPKQAILLALFCTNVSRTAIADMIGVSINTLKTRVRLLLRQFGKKYIDELVAEFLLAAGKQEKLTCPHAPAIVDVGARTPSERELEELEGLGPLAALKRCRTWQDIAARLTPELLGVPVADLPMLPRMRSFGRAHGIKSLHELLAHPALKCGEVTFKNTRSMLGELMEHPGDVPTPYKLTDECSAAQAFEERLNILTPRQRDIVEARSGLNGATETLLQIGTRLGNCRQRIRQIEQAALLKLSGRGFADALEARIREIWHGQVVALDDASVSWLGGSGKQDQFVSFVLDRFVAASHRPHLVQVWGQTYLMPLSQHAFDSEVQQAKQRLARLTYPASRATVLAAIAKHGQRAELTETLLRSVHDGLLWAPDEQEALAFGTDHKERMLAVLRASEKPLPSAQLRKHLDTGTVSPQAIHFESGLVGLEQHFPELLACQEEFTLLCRVWIALGAGSRARRHDQRLRPAGWGS